MHAFTPLVSARTGAGARALRSLYPLISEDAPTVEIHVAMTGEWEGHGSGALKLTRKDFETICARFEANPNPIPLDYEHATVYAAEAPAAGWIHRVYVRDDENGDAHLWVTAELTDKAAGYIKSGEYRFSSGVFEFGAVDHVTGQEVGVELTSVALTNVPFLTGARPIQLSRRASSAANRKELSVKFSRDSLLKALDLIEADELTIAELEAAAQMAAAQDGGLGAEEAEEPEEAPMAAPDEEPAAMADSEEEDEAPMSAPAAGDAVEAADAPEDPAAMAEDMPGEDPESAAAAAAVAPLLEATGLDMAGLAAAIQENLDAVASALSGALEAPAAEAPLSTREAELALSARDTTIAQLSAKLSDLESFKATREREDAERDVDTLIAGGLLLGDAREDWVQVRLSSRERFDKLTRNLKPVVPLGTHASAVTPPAKNADESIPIPNDDPEVIALRRQLGPSGARLPEARINEVIRRRIAARN